MDIKARLSLPTDISAADLDATESVQTVTAFGILWPAIYILQI